MVMFTWGASIFFTASRPPNDAIQIYAVGKQWMWKLEHLEGQREINELHIPVGTPVRLTMTSEDVIHSFFVPAFRTKQDVLPGRYTTTWFKPTKPGKYHLFCAEYCGTNHSGMIGWVYVMEPQGLPELAERRRRRRLAWPRTARSSSSSSPAATATRKTTPAAGPPGRRLRQTGATRRRRHRQGRRGLLPRIHPAAAGQGGRRLRAGDADLPGPGHRRASGATRGVREIVRPETGNRPGGYGQQKPATKNPRASARQSLEPYDYRSGSRTRALLQCQLWPEIVAPDQGPQAHRPAVSLHHHPVLLHRRRLRHADSHGTADAAGRPGEFGDLQQALHHARRGDDLLLPDPVDPGRAGELLPADHDRRARSGIPQDQPAELVSAGDRRRRSVSSP